MPTYTFDFSDLSDEEIDEKIRECRSDKKNMTEQGDDLISHLEELQQMIKQMKAQMSEMLDEEIDALQAEKERRED